MYQHLTDIIFKKFLDDHFKIEYLDNTADDDLEMRKNEKGVLCYIAGFICRHLRKQLECESDQFKEEMILCLMEMVKSRIQMSWLLQMRSGQI